MEENGMGHKVTPSDDRSHPWEVEIEILTGLAAWISFEVVLSSDNPVIPGSQWGGSEWSRMGISRVVTENPTGPAALGSLLGPILFHLPPPASLLWFVLLVLLTLLQMVS